MRQRLFARILSILMLIAIACMMVFFSAEDGPTSSARSGQIARFVARYAVSGYRDMSPERQAAVVDRLQYPIRKAGHMAEYALLAFWLCVFLRSLSVRGWKNPVFALIGAGLFAATDETHQMFVSGRGPSVTDVGIDCIGAAVGILVAMAMLGMASRWLAKREKGRC